MIFITNCKCNFFLCYIIDRLNLLRMLKTIALITAGLTYFVFIFFILFGAGYITNILFNYSFKPDLVGLNTDLKLQTARMTIVMFWLTFVPLAFGAPLLIKKQFLD